MASESDIKAAVAAADAAKVESLLTEGAPADAAVLGEALVRLVRASTEHDNDSPFDSMFTDAMLGALRQGGLQITVDSTQAAALGDALNTGLGDHAHLVFFLCPAAPCALRAVPASPPAQDSPSPSPRVLELRAKTPTGIPRAPPH